ncbi:MAG: class III poly(R)-hydroxyalkanoic acid synthase subunit PhaC [Deltaproteobacteria bacterium]|nr:class III poly(R)-hydroxyalkanoic acid synthase subunit PhaC [Deltaproteobacteria bacterium]
MPPPKIPVDLIMARLAQEAGEARHRLEKARDILMGPLETDIAATPYDVVYEEDRIKLKYYRPARGPQIKTPLLVVSALIHRETILDLQPGRSVVQNLLKEGLEVYLIDWGHPTRKDRWLTIDDHVNGYMDNVIDFIRRRHGLNQINLMGVCMGGNFSLMYGALHPEKIKNLITVVTPSNFDTDKGLLHLWMKEIDADRLVDAFGNLPGDLLNIGLLLLNPARLMFDKYVGFLENMDNQEFVENFIRMEKWIFDTPAVPGETFRQFIKDCYQRNLLIQSRMELGGARVDLQQITMPLLNVYARYDHLVPPEACDRLTQCVGSRDTEDLCLDTGHIGIYVSHKCQKELVPKIARWLKEREGSKEAPAEKPARKKAARKRKPASK